MSDWKLTTLGEIVKQNQGLLQTGPFGSQLHASDYVKEGIPCIMPANIQNTRIDLSKIAFIDENDAQRLSKHITKVGDIIFSRRGDITLKALIRKEQNGFFCGTGCILVRPGQKIDSEFLIYYLSTPSSLDWILSKAVGATMPNINTKILSNYPINLPPQETQSQIAKILSDIDSKIELNNKLNSELEAMSKLIYDYWFVQFDFPDDNGKPYQSSGGRMVWNKELKKEIPENWNVLKLSEHFEFEKGIEPGSSEYTNEKISNDHINFIRVGDINGSSEIFINSSTKKYSLVSPREVLVTFDGSVGKTAFGLNGAYSGGLRKVYDKTGLIDNSLIYYIFKDERIIKTIHKYSSGSILMHAGKSIEYLKIPFLQSIYLKYQNTIKESFNKMVITKEENKKLAELRDWLLPMLMNGQVTVLDSEQNESELKIAAEPTVAYGTKADKENDYLKRKQLALHILAKSRIDQQLGKVKFEKLLHLCEYHIVKENTNQQFHQHAAGPYDPAFTHRFFADAKKELFASITKQGAMHKIEVSKTIDSHLQADLFSEEALQKMDELIQHFMGSNHEKPEVISTLYAVWNNRIIRNALITDELLKADFLAWSEGKSRYENQLDRNLKWMRNNGIVPDGWGKVIGR